MTQITLGDIEDERVYTPKQIEQITGALSSKEIISALKGGQIAGVELGPRTYRITGRSFNEWVRPDHTWPKPEYSGKRPAIGVAQNRQGNWVSKLPEAFEKNEMKGQVYFIDCLECTKIGFTVNPIRMRMDTWLCGNPFELQVFALMPGNGAQERAFHSRFSKYRRCREWFVFDDAARNEVVELVSDGGGVILEGPAKRERPDGRRR